MRGEEGQILAIVIIFMLLGCVILTPLLQYMGTGIKTGTTFQNKTDELYTADAGIQDGTWQVKYNGISTFTTPVTYNSYDYSDNWSYLLSGQVNAKSANVTIANVWVPKNLATPTQSQATSIIQTGKLLVSDSSAGSTTWKINITYSWAKPEALAVTALGVWLPPGFTYVAGSSNLWNKAHSQRLYSSETTYAYDSGQAVIWTFSPAYPFAGDASHDPFPGVTAPTGNSQVLTSPITFQFASQQAGATPGAVSWMATSGVSSIPFSWDADIKVFHITSVCGGTTVQTYLAKHDLRQLGAAINGDYRAIGNSLMVMGSGYTQSNDPDGIRHQLLTDSSATVSDIPSDATIVAAYLYWSGWLQSSSEQMGNSYGASINLKINNNQVYYDAQGNPQRGSSAIPSTKNQTYPINITGNGDYSYSCYRDVTALAQWELKQESPSASNYPGNATYDVGPASGCRLGDTGNEWSYSGWSLVLIYSSASTQGHQLYLYDKFAYADGNHGNGGNGADIDPTGNTAGPGGVISGFLVPPQVAGDVDAAKLTAFVGEGDWCYAGDFLAFNAPSQYWSNPWSIPDGDSSKLWDGITLDTSHLAAAPYLPNTATQPDNVWNSYSQSGLADGIDIKTFHITWASGLLHQGDTSARIDMPTQVDSWNLVYIILSFRSVTTTGGDISFLIRQ